MIYDISRNIGLATAVWPGDSPFAFDVISRRENDAGVNLTTLHMSAHTGTHADAPWHYDNTGRHPADLPLERYIGPAYVAAIGRQHGGIVPGDFEGHDLSGMQRLLIHTWVSDLADDQWPDDFPYPTPELIDWLAARGVVLLGIHQIPDWSASLRLLAERNPKRFLFYVWVFYHVDRNHMNL